MVLLDPGPVRAADAILVGRFQQGVGIGAAGYKLMVRKTRILPCHEPAHALPAPAIRKPLWGKFPQSCADRRPPANMERQTGLHQGEDAAPRAPPVVAVTLTGPLAEMFRKVVAGALSVTVIATEPPPCCPRWPCPPTRRRPAQRPVVNSAPGRYFAHQSTLLPGTSTSVPACCYSESGNAASTIDGGSIEACMLLTWLKNCRSSHDILPGYGQLGSLLYPAAVTSRS